MANAPQNYSGMEKLVECNICLERLQNAKVLDCGHEFCKVCIDKVLKFLPDKRAIVSCPLRCEKKTYIKADKTTNNLMSAMRLNNIIEFLASTEQKEENLTDRLKCNNREECTKNISQYCQNCGTKMCVDCKEKHDKEPEEADFIEIKYEQKEGNEFLPWCAEHSTYATYLCHDGFICMYCKYRTHAVHPHHSEHIDVINDQMIAWVSDKKPQLENLEELLQKSQIKSAEEAKVIRENLTYEMKRRKQATVKTVLEKLKADEKYILDSFDSMMSKHLAAYPSSTPLNYIADKAKFEIVLEREAITAKVNNIISPDVMVPHVTFEFPRTCPFQNWILSPNVTSTNLQDDVGTVESVIGETEVKMDELITLLTEVDLQDVVVKKKVENLKKIDNAFQNVICNAKKVADIIKEYEAIENNTLKMKYLIDMMEIDNVETFQILLKIYPEEILNLKCKKYKLIHAASLLKNQIFAEALLDAGEDCEVRASSMTPLHFAADEGNFDVIKTLIERDADIRAKTDAGRNAIDFAKHSNHAQIVEYLLAHLRVKNLEDTGVYGKKTISQLKTDDFKFEKKGKRWNVIKASLFH